jgi:cell division protein FtsW
VRALLKRFFQGNTILWMLFLALMVFSFLPVFSGSRNGLVGHLGFVALGLLMALLVHRLPSKYFGALALLGMALVVPLLAYTLLTGGTIAGANAARWFRIGGLSFQPSALANIVLIAHLSRVLTRKNAPKSLKEGAWNVILPLVLICGLVVPANLSTAGLIFLNASVVMWTAGFPRKAYGQLVGIFALFLLVFVLSAKAFPGVFPNRVDTWISRIENFSGTKENADTYQVDMAKMAIAQGHILGQGPGRGIQKNFLPQKNTDFIYALVIEEWGLLGGSGLALVYVWIFLQSVRVGQRAPDNNGHVLAIGLGFSIVFQAFINMLVAVDLFPVTGQTLPLVSEGGSSIVMTCMAMGMILSVSRGEGDDAEADGAFALGGAESILEKEPNELPAL